MLNGWLRVSCLGTGGGVGGLENEDIVLDLQMLPLRRKSPACLEYIVISNLTFKYRFKAHK